MEEQKMEQILKIMEQFEKTSINTLKYTNEGEEILLTKNKNGEHTSLALKKEDVKTKDEDSQEKSSNEDTLEVSSSEKEKKAVKEQEESLVQVESPIIGTYYSSPAPGKAAYVKKGDYVNKGDVLCIVEAMKVMNKIESEISGEIMEVCSEDGQPVEYGTCLFKIKPQ